MDSLVVDIELNITQSYYDTYYDINTVSSWQKVWDRILSMAYLEANKVEKLLVFTKDSSDNTFYKRKIPRNYPDINFEYAWSEFTRNYKGEIQIVPELKEIFVPRSLFECVGVYSFFKYSFPNCVIRFWD